ncbi:MAG: acyl-CoA dehydrogenase C-terminal domain-containing protein, partial [Caulobacteraceae bacterium]
IIEGGRALLYWTYLQQDLEHRAEDEETKQKAADRLGLLTPVAKAFLTGRGFQICSDALQVHGGSGFTTHFPAEQYLRDCRIALIYEGTNGIQALDLVGRKLPAKGGRAIMAFLADCDAYATELDGDEALKPFADGLRSSKGQLQDATMWLMQNGMQNPDNAGAAAHDYLNLMALTCMAWSWGMIAKAAQGKIAAGDADAFYANKLATGSYFLERILPEAAMHLAKIKSGAAPVMALPTKAF